jgi:integrase
MALDAQRPRISVGRCRHHADLSEINLGDLGELARSTTTALGYDEADRPGESTLLNQRVDALAELAFTEPKTRRGRRSLALDRRTVEILEAHRRRQLEERIALGLGRPRPNGLIFTDPLGEPVRPDSFSQMFDRRVRGLDLPRIRLHNLRHGAATLMLASGANVKTVSERLGHASTVFTMDVYAASVPALEDEAAAKVAALFE